MKKTFFFDETGQYEFERTNEVFEKTCNKIYNKVKHYLVDKNEGVLTKYKQRDGHIKNITKVLFVGGSSRLPFIRRLAGEEKLNYSLNADMCVAEIAAYYSSNLIGYLIRDLHLVDVVPMYIGICVGEDEFTEILESNAALPALRKKTFTTSVDIQLVVSIKVAQV